MRDFGTATGETTPSGDNADWVTMRRFLPYLWPKNRPDLRLRIALATLLVIAAKAVTLALPFAYAGAVDAMAADGDGLLWPALSLVLAYAAGRFGAVLFEQFRNIAFNRVSQDAVRSLAEDVFTRLHQLSLRFHLSRRTGEITRIMERGTRSIGTMLYFLLFNILPTVIELTVVAVVFYTLFGWELLLATALTVVAFVWSTQAITEWRVKLRKEMNDLDGQAMARAVDSLLNYETVKYFSAEERELLDLYEEIAAGEDLALDMELSPGDIQWLNNHQILHSRTRFDDYPDTQRRRWLLRLWLNFDERDRFSETYGFYGIARDDQAAANA